MKSWNWFLERTQDYQDEPAEALSNKEDLFLYLKTIFMLLDNKKVLDVGCGRSEELKMFMLTELQIKEYMGLDFKDYNNGSLVSDMHDMNIEDCQYDVAIYNNVLEHSISPYLALLEANRVLKLEGIIIVGLPFGVGHDVGESHFINLTKTQLQNLLQKTGFKLIDSKTVGSMLYYALEKWK